VRSVAIFVLGSEARPLERVGFVARGDLPRERLVQCVQSVVEEDGGGLRRVEIEGVAAVASEHGPSRAAFLGGDRLVGGDELIVREAIRVDRGDAPGADRDATLAQLWRRAEGRREVVLVAHLPPSWRSSLARLGGDVQLEGMRAVRALGLGARIERGLGLTLALETDAPSSAQTLVAEARARIAALRADPMLGLSAAGATLRRIDLEADGQHVVLTLDLDEDQLASLVQLGRDAIARRRAATERGRRERSMAPDERLEAGADSAAAAP
jgi:hypothetical protein